MEYYRLLNLDCEPFSNTPDPGLFFRSTGHAKCLQELEIAIRLHRGLCVVAGEVGTGKTTICRHLIRSMANEGAIEIQMILDPSFESADEILAVLNAMFNGRQQAEKCSTAAGHKEMIKDYLFRNGVGAQKTIVLLVDEGQKLFPAGVEIFRELLNFETNDQKLLQIVIFGQNEIDRILADHPNFADRVGLFHRLLPLSRKDTALFIDYRLERSGGNDPQKPRVHFTRRALSLIHKLTGGYPRKIINLCHNILLTLIIVGTFKVTPAIVRRAGHQLPSLNRTPGCGRLPWALGTVAVAAAGLWLFFPYWQDRLEQPNCVIQPAITKGAADQSIPKAEPLTKTFEVQARADAAPLETIEATPETGAADTVQPPVDNARDQENPPAPMLPPGPPPTAARSDSDSDSTGPPSLGSLRVQSDETLWSMIRRIYGTCNSQLLARVVGHNPAIQNPDRILRGQRIDFPAIALRPDAEKNRYWIEIDRFYRFGEAYAAVRAEMDVPLRILALRTPENGFEYLVVVNASFGERQSAADCLATLPSEQAARAKVTDLGAQALSSRL